MTLCCFPAVCSWGEFNGHSIIYFYFVFDFFFFLWMMVYCVWDKIIIVNVSIKDVIHKWNTYVCCVYIIHTLVSYRALLCFFVWLKSNLCETDISNENGNSGMDWLFFYGMIADDDGNVFLFFLSLFIIFFFFFSIFVNNWLIYFWNWLLIKIYFCYIYFYSLLLLLLLPELSWMLTVSSQLT